MLALHADHSLSLAGAVVIQSLPLTSLSSPLDQAVEVSSGHSSTTAAATASSGAGLGVRSVLNNVCKAQLLDMQAHQAAIERRNEHVARLGGKMTPAGAAASAAPLRTGTASVVFPGLSSSMAAETLGLTPSQARTLVAAQVAVPALKGAPRLRTLHDVLHFVSLHNPRSRYRVAQRVAHGGARTGTLRSPTGSDATDSESADDKRWMQLICEFQRLIDEHIQCHLSAVYEQVTGGRSTSYCNIPYNKYGMVRIAL